MINQKRIDSLIEKHQKVKYTTRTILNNSGFTDYDIRKLISLGILKRMSPGQFYVQKQNYINIDSYYQKIYESLLQRDYNEVIKYFYDIFKSNKEANKKDNIFYLYLLSLIIDLHSTKLNEYLSLCINEILLKDNKTDYLNDMDIQIIKREILNHNYILALKLLYEIEKERNLSIQERILLCLLKQIIEKEIRDKKTIKLSIKDNDKYSKLKEYLKIFDTYNIIKTLKEYLRNINKLEYIPLLINIIKLCILKKDPEYDLLFDILNKITNKEYKYSYIEYLNKFYKSIINKDYEEARIYLNIIKEMSEVQSCSFVSSLEKQLEEEMNTKELKNVVVSNEDRKFIKSLYEDLIKGNSPIILKNLDNDKIKRYIYLLSSYSVHVQLHNNSLIIIYIVNNKILPNSYELLWKMDKCFNDKNYEECIKIGLLLLQNSFFETKIYLLMGTSYYKMENFKLSKVYLTIYEMLHGKIEQVSEVPNEIKGKKDKEIFTINHEYFGVEDFLRIDELIKKSKLSVYDFCLNMGYSTNKTCIILLIYAREYYNQGFIKKSNEFLQAVENIKGKTTRVLKILEYVKRDRKLAKNKPNTSSLTLSLTLKSNC